MECHPPYQLGSHLWNAIPPYQLGSHLWNAIPHQLGSHLWNAIPPHQLGSHLWNAIPPINLDLICGMPSPLSTWISFVECHPSYQLGYICKKHHKATKKISCDLILILTILAPFISCIHALNVQTSYLHPTPLSLSLIFFIINFTYNHQYSWLLA